MNEVELRKIIGSKVKYYRKRRKLTQKELGDIIGVENNTVSAYERGAISMDQDILFKLSDALEVGIDDLFPDKKHTTNELQRALEMNKDLDIDDLEYLNQLIEKTLSMDEEERAKFLNDIRFMVEYHERNK